jgi:hypothetical protein
MPTIRSPTLASVYSIPCDFLAVHPPHRFLALLQDERDVPDRLFVKAASLQMMERAAQRFKKKMGRFSSMAGRPSSGDHVHGSDSPLSTLSPNWNSSTPPPIKGKVSQGKKADPE